MREPVTFFTFCDKTAFIHLKDLYAECFVLIEPHEQLVPMQCFYAECHANRNCGETIARRVDFLFERVLSPEVGMLIAYFKYRDRPKSIKGVVFRKPGYEDQGDLPVLSGAAASGSDPKVMILNRSAFYRCKKEGKVYQWVPSDDYLYLGNNNNKIIPVENLIRS